MIDGLGIFRWWWNRRSFNQLWSDMPFTEIKLLKSMEDRFFYGILFGLGFLVLSGILFLLGVRNPPSLNPKSTFWAFIEARVLQVWKTNDAWWCWLLWWLTSSLCMWWTQTWINIIFLMNLLQRKLSSQPKCALLRIPKWPPLTQSCSDPSFSHANAQTQVTRRSPSQEENYWTLVTCSSLRLVFAKCIWGSWKKLLSACKCGTLTESNNSWT